MNENSNKINDLCVSVGRLEGKIDGVIDFQNKMWGLYGKHGERIEDLEEKPSAVKAVLWTGAIIGIFVTIATFIMRTL